MTVNQSPDQHQTKTSGWRSSAIWRRLTEPATPIPKPERRRARLLAALLVALIPLFSVGMTSSLLTNEPTRDPRSIIMTVATLILLIAYGLSRTRHARWGAALTVGLFFVAPFAVVVLRADYSSRGVTDSLIWLVLPVLLSGLLLSWRGTGILAAGSIAVVLSLPLLISGMALRTIAFPLGFILTTCALIVVAAAIRYRDTTERQRAEEALRNSEERHRALFNHIPDPVFIFDKTTHRFLECNQSALNVYGYSLDELRSMTPFDLHPPEDAAKVERNIDIRNVDRPFTYTHVTKQGKRFDVEILSDDIEYQGRPAWISIVRDITERKQTDKALRRIIKAVENSGEAIAIFDATEHTYYYNPTFIRTFGYSAEELTASGGALSPCRDQNVVTEAREVLMSGRSWIGEIEMRTRTGESLAIALRADAIKDENGEVIGRVGIFTDITERKRAEMELRKAKEAAEAATRAKSEFLANMSHEIRTPMNAIIGMTSLLLETHLTPDQQEYAETIRSSGDTLLTIINDILDFSKIESGKLELEQQPFDLRTCIEESLDLLAPQAAEKGLDLAYLIDDATPGTLIGDVTRLRQILVNLLSNAVKFTDAGEVVVSVTTGGSRLVDPDVPTEDQPLPQVSRTAPHASRTTPHQIHVAVKDTGIGIPPERMDRLFKSFSQVDTSTTRHYGGTGLGLAISKRLAEMMGGTMWVESEVGRGSTFHFTIVAESAPSQPRVYLRSVQPQLSGKRMLIVDDNATNRRILRLQAQSWGMLPRATASGSEALDWIRRGDPFDIAILDMHMPEMDGLTLAREIRAYRDAQALPLVMLTSMGQREGEAQAGRFAACLTKPIKPSQLYNVLIRVLDGQPTKVRLSSSQQRIDARLAERVPLRILLAEDNVVNQKVALRILRKMGYRADVASNGLEALQALERQSYDVVLMDVQMPEMDGLEAARHICQQYPEGNRPRIIAMTANAMEGDREACLAAGMDDYISKPVRVDELQAALERCAPPATNQTNPRMPRP